MKNKLKQLLKQENASAIYLVSIALMGLLAIAGLAIDGGSLYVTKTQLQKAANAAALSGAQELTQDEAEAAVTAVVDRILTEHEELSSKVELTVEPDKKVKVRLRKQVPLSFSGLFGYDAAPVEVSAAAEIMTMGKANGAAPLGIDESIPLEFNREYSLKVDQSEVSSGNFGILALGGTGANTYEDNLKNGYQNEISIDDILETQTGNVAGKTREGVQQRIDLCPYPVGETDHRDCPRIILIPVYRPHNFDSNQLKDVKITGFAYFYISAPMSSNDTSITGMFIKRAGTGFVDPGKANNGAFGIRLTE